MFVTHRSTYRVGALCLVALLAAAAGPAHAAIPRYPDIMPLKQVRAGMVGYGLTVFHGTKIERFQVTVVGVVKDGSLVVPGHDMILVRMSGGPMTGSRAPLIRGMSGSPVYVNGKIIGAFSQGEPTTKEPLGGVTPIEDMLEAWDPSLPTKPAASMPDTRVRTVRLDSPIQAGARRIARVVYNVPASMDLRSHGDTLVMHPCTTMVTFSSLTDGVRRRLTKLLAPYNVEVAQGMQGGTVPGFKGAPLVPGAALSIMLTSGDIVSPATGTVTYRKGNRILAFGHPFMRLGPIEAPLTSAYVYDVYPLLSGSYKISSPGPVVGASSQDRNFAISGYVGRQPKTVPVTIDVHDHITGRSRVFHVQTVDHPNLTAGLVSATVGIAVGEVHSMPGPAMAKVTTTVDADEIGKVTRSNVMFDARDISDSASGDLDDLLGVLTGNPFYPLGIKDATVRVDVEAGHKTAQVERIFVKEGRFEPGETAEVGVVLKPYKEPAVTRTVHVKIPADTPTGRYVLQVRGGAAPGPVSIAGLLIRPSTPVNPDLAPPANIRQMVKRYDEREKNNEIVARISLPTTAVNVEGERLSGLPPSLDAVMRSARSSGVRIEREEVREVLATDWVVSGQQTLTINVQRHEMQESPAASSPATTSQPTITTPPPSTTTSTYPGRDDDDEPVQAAMFAQRQKDPKKPSQPRGKGETKPADQQPPAGQPPAATAPAPSQPAPPAADDKPVGRVPTVWRQSARADLAKGQFEGLSVTARGDLALTRTLKRLASTTEGFVWSLVPDGKGGLFAGTGTQARILHVDASGTASVLATLPDAVSVQALLLAPDGVLWAATGPHGRVYRVAPDGTATDAYDAPEKYALALARDSQGRIYVGTGGGAGNIYRIGADGKGALFCHTAEDHVLSLAVGGTGDLYAGTGTSGVVYRVSPDGRATVLYDAAEASITGLAVGPNGDVYAATAPRGVIYRIKPDGTARALYDKAPAALTAMVAAPGGTIYAAGGSAVYAIGPGDEVVPFGNHTDVDILSLALAADGTLYAGTGNVAEVYAAPPDAGPSRKGTYESVVHDAKERSRWGAIRWTATTPAGTRLRLETRTGNVAEPDSTWSSWAAPRPEPDGGRILSPEGRFVQYRVTMESDTAGVSPALRDVAVSFLPRNQGPKVTIQTPAGGERWAGQQSIKWDASDPDRDALTYDVAYSSDGGAHWQPLPGLSPAATTTVPAPHGTTGQPPAPQVTVTVTTQAPRRPLSVEQVQAELDKHPDVPAALREAVLERARQANAEYDARASQAATTAAPAAPGAGAAARQTSRTLDTHTLPDGTYILRVTASDRPANPTDPMTAEVVSEPFVICNTAPALYLLQGATRAGADGRVHVEGTAVQKLIAVTAAQYRVDGGEWVSAVPADGLFDSPVESFTIDTAPIAPGQHTVEVKVFNAAGTSAADKVAVDVPARAGS